MYLSTKNGILLRFQFLDPKSYVSLLLVVVSIFCSTSILATESGHAKKHAIGAFIGVMDNGETENVVGLEYEYRLNSKWGVGALYEKASDAHHGDGLTTKIAAVYYHPAGAWRLGVGLGSEKVGGAHPHSEDLTRLGVSYDFHFGGIGIAPSLNLDRIDGETVKIYGVAFIWSF